MGYAAAAQAAISVAMSIFGHNAKKKQAEKQAIMNHLATLHMYDQYLQTAKELGTQQQAANEEVADGDDSFSLEAARHIASAQVQSDSTGIGGATQYHLLEDIQRKNAQHTYKSGRSLHYSGLQIQSQYIAAAMRYEGQESSTPQVVKPSNGYLAASIGSDVANAASSYFGSK